MSQQGASRVGSAIYSYPHAKPSSAIDASRIRYLIVSDGRTGSSLIAAILGAAGANLGMSHVENWDQLYGAHEFPEMARIDRLLEQAQYLTELSRKLPAVRHVARLWRSLAKRRVRRLMTKTVYLKISPYAAPFIFKLGLTPRVIAVYRDFGDLARSKMLAHRMPWPAIANRCLMTYRNALICIHTFGGCAISYEEMMDPGQSAWIDALASCTGLPRQLLLDARARIVKPTTIRRTAPFRLDERLDHLQEDLRSLRGRYVTPSESYLETVVHPQAAPIREAAGD
jgi:hypothetical protein